MVELSMVLIGEGCKGTSETWGMVRGKLLDGGGFRVGGQWASLPTTSKIILPLTFLQCDPSVSQHIIILIL